MQQREFVLAALAASGRKSLSPVQVQKLLFLLDRNIGARLGGSGFDFKPYHYGPFDRTVYSTLEQLQREGLAEIASALSPAARKYSLSEAGQRAGEEILSVMEQPVQDYIAQVGEFVRSQSFAGLVSSIYRAYPEMKANSVFQQ